MADTAIVVKNLSKTFQKYKRGAGFLESLKSFFKREYETKYAVKNISFSINKGERVGFVGPNGAGKSTTIKMLVGVLKPTEGYVSVLDMNPYDERMKLAKRYGVVFGHRTNLLWDVPPIDSYYIFKEIYDVKQKDFDERLKVLSEGLALKDYLYTPTRKLSLGERMRAELGLKMLYDPELLFLDEPTIGLDVVGKKQVKDFLLDMNKRFNTTILLTSHDMSDVENICERIIIINEGAIIFDGSIKSLKQKYAGTKTLELRFEKPLSKESLFGKPVVEKEANTYRVILDDKEDTGAYLRQVFTDKSNVLVDIKIIDVDLTEIIRGIFEGK